MILSSKEIFSYMNYTKLDLFFIIFSMELCFIIYNAVQVVTLQQQRQHKDKIIPTRGSEVERLAHNQLGRRFTFCLKVYSNFDKQFIIFFQNVYFDISIKIKKNHPSRVIFTFSLILILQEKINITLAKETLFIVLFSNSLPLKHFFWFPNR